jgi:hypothetical protein
MIVNTWLWTFIVFSHQNTEILSWSKWDSLKWIYLRQIIILTSLLIAYNGINWELVVAAIDRLNQWLKKIVLCMLYYWAIGFTFALRTRDLSLLHNIQTGPGAHPASYPMEMKWLVHEENHSSQYNAKIKNEDSIPPLSNTSSWLSA